MEKPTAEGRHGALYPCAYKFAYVIGLIPPPETRGLKQACNTVTSMGPYISLHPIP